MGVPDLWSFIQLFRTWPNIGPFRVSALYRIRFVAGVSRLEKLLRELIFRVPVARGVCFVLKLFIVLVTKG